MDRWVDGWMNEWVDGEGRGVIRMRGFACSERF